MHQISKYKNMTTHTNDQRYHDLDALRAFAMLLGIVLHSMMSFAGLPVDVNGTQDVYQDSPVYGWLMDAIHGFRMPLFFLVSGMFTALLWRRRGVGGLIRHRSKRIALPLAIGLFTIVPAVFAVSILCSRNVWYASARGDSDYIASYVAASGNVDAIFRAEMQAGNGSTPLHLAAASSQHAVAEQLLRAGANVNSVAFDVSGDGPSLATPLHWATAMSDSEMMQLLIEHHAEVNQGDAKGQTPLDYVAEDAPASVEKVLVSHGGKRGTELGDAVVPAPATSLLADSRGHTDFLGDWIRESSMPVQLFAVGVFFPAFVHLWFLWYLLWLVAAFCIAAWLQNRFAVKPLPTWMFHSPTMWVWVLPPTFAVQLLMVQGFGPDTASGLIPWPPTLLYYSLFFGFGALYQCRKNSDFRLGERYRLCFVLALAILPIGIFANGARDQSFLPYHALASLVSAVYVWLMILGMFGVFRYAFSTQRRWVRYVSDASYWIYLIHLPIVLWLQAWVADWLVLGALKVALLCTITFALALVSYEIAVRYTWIGALLHGRKYRTRDANSRLNQGATLPLPSDSQA